jgi:hypothetical protein
MPYYYGTATQQSTNGTANTDTFLMSLLGYGSTANYLGRGVLQKLMCGTYVTPADNATRIRAHRTTTVSAATSTVIVPNPLVPDAPAAQCLSYTLPTGAVVGAVPMIQLGYNQRGTAMWAAFNADEGIGVLGNATVSKSEVLFDSQSTGTSVPVTIGIVHSE